MTTPKISKETESLLTPNALLGDDDEGTEIQRETKPKEDLSEVEKLLTPKNLIDHPDPLAGTPGELVPDDLRGGEDEDDELQAEEKTPDEKESAKVSISFGGRTLGEWLERQAKDKTEKAESEKLKQEIEAHKVEDENEEIRESFKRVSAKMKADDLTPDNLK